MVGLVDIRCIDNNNNNKHFFNLQVANSPSRLRFEANLSRESSECTEHSQVAEVSVKVLAKLSKKSIDGSFGNALLMKYRDQYWHYFLKVLLTTLAITILN